MEVVQHHHQRPGQGEHLEEPPERPMDVLGRPGALLDAEDLADALGDAVGVLHPPDEPRQDLAGARGVGRVEAGRL